VQSDLDSQQHLSAAEREPKRKLADQMQRRMKELEQQLDGMRDKLKDYVRLQRLRAQVYHLPHAPCPMPNQMLFHHLLDCREWVQSSLVWPITCLMHCGCSLSSLSVSLSLSLSRCLSVSVCQDDSRIRQLQAEIEAMKKQRVTVQRQIKEQADKHRAFLQDADMQIKTMKRRAVQRDKEVCNHLLDP
jgi:exonuclease VII large subunit